MTIKIEKMWTGRNSKQISGYFVTCTVGRGKNAKTVGKIVASRKALARYLQTRAIQPLPYQTTF
jgi:hypothetical protein